jgi:hypothetical protein
MYAHLITANVYPSQMEAFTAIFCEQILPAVSREHGFKSTYMMKNAAQNQIMVIMFWETEAAAQINLDAYLQPSSMTHLLIGQPTAETLEVILRA